jgi:hypothetical protein
VVLTEVVVIQRKVGVVKLEMGVVQEIVSVVLTEEVVVIPGKWVWSRWRWV